MDKVKIQEVAEEAGLSNTELLDKAKELGFDVKAANSTISLENAGILVEYAISGTLPKGFKKPSQKPKTKVVKKKQETAAQEHTEASSETVEEPVSTQEKQVAGGEVVSETVTPEIDDTKEVPKTVTTEETQKPKEAKKRKGISVVSKKSEPEVYVSGVK